MKINILLSVIGLLFPASLFASADSQNYYLKNNPDSLYYESDSGIVFAVVENNPDFPGGPVELMKYVYSHIEIPPCEDMQISERIYVQVVVEKDGSLSNIKLLKKSSCTSFNSEIIRIVKSMPKWIPGKQSGQLVRAQYNFPVKLEVR